MAELWRLHQVLLLGQKGFKGWGQNVQGVLGGDMSAVIAGCAVLDVMVSAI